MPITTLDGLVNALANNSQRVPWNKGSLSNATAGTFFSLWRATGVPGQGTQPTTPTICTSATAGAMPFTHPGAGLICYAGRAFGLSSITGNDIQIHDRLAHRAGLVGNSTAAQTVDVAVTATSDNLPERIGSADFSDVQWWIEIQADIGTTATTASISYTNGAGTPGQTLSGIAIGSTTNSQNRAGRLIPLAPADGIQSIQTLTLTASTGTAGNIAVFASRLIMTISLGLGNSGVIYDWNLTGLSRVPADACLFPIVICGSTTTGTVLGNLQVIAG